MKFFNQEQLNEFLRNAPRDNSQTIRYFITAAVLDATLKNSFPNGVKLIPRREDRKCLTANGFGALVAPKEDRHSAAPSIGVHVNETDVEGELTIIDHNKRREGAIQVWCEPSPQPEEEIAHRSRNGSDYFLLEGDRIVFASALMDLEEMFATYDFSLVQEIKGSKKLEPGTMYFTHSGQREDIQPWSLGKAVKLRHQLSEPTISDKGEMVDCYCFVVDDCLQVRQEWYHSSNLFTQPELVQMATEVRNSSPHRPQHLYSDYLQGIVDAMKYQFVDKN